MNTAARLVIALFLVVLVVTPALCQTNNGPTQEDLLRAIQTLKDASDPNLNAERGFRGQFNNARLILKRNPEQSLDLVIGLLRENDLQVRVNGAITLAEIAQSGHITPKVLEGLNQCMRDSNPAIVYWGLSGLAARGVPEETLQSAIIECLDVKEHPQILRMTAATIAGDKNIKSVLPWLVEYLTIILPSYDFQVEEHLKVPLGQTGATGTSRSFSPARSGEAPRSRMAPGRATRGIDAEESRLRRTTPGRTTPGRTSPSRTTPGRTTPGRTTPGRTTPGRTTPGRTTPGRTTPGRTTPGRTTLGRTTPGRTTPGWGERTEEEEVEWVPQFTIIDPDTDPEYVNSEKLQALAEELEALPAVAELHALGFIIEKLAKKDLRDEPFTEALSFETNPPWRLRPCAEAAIAWMEKNKAQFPMGPAPAKPAEKEAAPAEGIAEPVKPTTSEPVKPAAEAGEE